jgi:hypothetical protein
LAACKSNDCESCDSHVDFYVCRTDDDGCTDNYCRKHNDYFNNDVFVYFVYFDCADYHDYHDYYFTCCGPCVGWVCWLFGWQVLG